MGMRILKKIIILILSVAALWTVLNFEYVRKNVEYLRRGKTDATPIVQEQEKIEPNILIIPSLDITVPVKYAERVDENHYQELLLDGVVHYPGTAEIGQPGNAYIFGHSSDNAWSKGHYKTVFALLPKMTAGEEIYISDREGRKYIYKVFDARVVAKNDLSVLSQDTAGRKLLTLQTSYPVGTSLKRFVVVAELMD